MSQPTFKIEVVTSDKNKITLTSDGFLPGGEPIPHGAIYDAFDRMCKITSEMLRQTPVQDRQKQEQNNG